MSSESGDDYHGKVEADFPDRVESQPVAAAAALHPVLHAPSEKQWDMQAPAPRQTALANVLRQGRRVLLDARNIQSLKDSFKLFITNEIVDIVTREIR